MEIKKMRCHFSIIVENAASLLGVLLAIAVSQLDDIVENLSKLNNIEGKSYFIGLGLFLILVIIVLLFNLNRWFRTIIWIENGTLIVERNTLNKKKNTYTIKNISNIDMEQNLFERVVGTYKIKIDSNSSALAKKTDIKIVFSRQVAIEFKKVIMASMGQMEDTNLFDSEEETFDIVYSAKDVIMNCFYSANLFSIIILLGGFVGFFILMSFGDNHYTIQDFLKDAIGGFAALMIAVISAAYSLIKGFFRYYNFKIKRDDKRIHLSYGLFRKNIHTIPIDKINGIKLVQPFFSRIFGRYQVEVINVGTGDEKNESANILLSCTKSELKSHIAILLPEFEDFIDKPIKKQSPKYFLHMAYQLVIFTLGITIGISTFNYLSDYHPIWIECFITVSILVICILCYIVSYLAGGYYIGEEYLVLAKGIFTRTFYMIQYEKIQSIRINESLMSKVTKLKKSTVFILAALVNSVMYLPLVEEDILEDISEKMIKAQ